MNIDLSASLVTDHLSPVLEALGLETYTGEDVCCGLLEFPKSQRSGSLFWCGDFTLLLWAGSAEIGSPLDLSCLDSPECVWSGWLCLEFVAIVTDSLLGITGYGNGSHPVY